MHNKYCDKHNDVLSTWVGGRYARYILGHSTVYTGHGPGNCGQASVDTLDLECSHMHLSRAQKNLF